MRWMTSISTGNRQFFPPHVSGKLNAVFRDIPEGPALPLSLRALYELRSFMKSSNTCWRSLAQSQVQSSL